MSICYDVCIHFIGCVWENNEPKERQKAMNRKIWKALGIAVCMLALAAPRAMAKTYEVWTSDKFAEAVQEINNKSSDTKNEIVLCDDIELTSGQMLTRGETTIKSKDENRKISIISINGSNAGITVTGEKTTLNLGAEGYDKTLTIEGDTGIAFITVSDRATANMYKNVTLQNRKSAINAYVLVTGSDPVTGSKSVFNMKGGVIEGGSRAVIAKSGATFNMSGGEIRNCKGDSGGGVHVYGATFVMSGGTISGCTADNGGGLCAEKFSTIEISGGTISGCTTSEAGMGGGLYAYQSTITISRGTIENNKATYGGGVALLDSTINSITNWKVIGNEAYKTKRGNGGIGGGIYLDNNVSMDVSNGSNRIYNNTAEGHGADICLEKGASITLPDAAGMGATFLKSGINIDGWYNDNPRYTPSKDGEAEKELKLSGKKSLVASYKATSVYIKIDTNGGKGGSGSQTVQKGTTVTLEAPTKEGYLFTGWEDENKKIYPAGEDGKVNITVTGDMTLTAVWKPRTFTVTYVLLDGKTRTETVNYGETVTLGEEPRTGYTFVGWKDGEKMYHAGETITVTENMTLTAVWEARTFTVTYVLLNGETRTETVDYGQKLTLVEEPRTGYTFVGWKDGEKVHQAGETITVTEDKTLTAVWKARTFTVTYVLLNGKTRTETVDYGQKVTLGEEPRTGYTFVGWKDGEKMYHAGETITVTGDMTLTAEWKKLPSAENLPKTGDESPVLLWGAALAISAAACFVLRRKK